MIKLRYMSVIERIKNPAELQLEQCQIKRRS
jgi:hypothetical protein